MRVIATTSLLVLLAAPSALAAPSDAEHAAAVESFHRGTDLVEAGKLQDAVDAFRDALRHEPSGVGARLDLADCYEKMGAPAAAWREYAIAATYARKAADVREAMASSSAAGLEARLLVVKLVGAPVPGMDVRVDGDPVATEILARASFAVAPGRHRVELSAAGKVPIALEVEGAAGETRTVPFAFEDVPASVAAPAVPSSLAPPASLAPPDSPASLAPPPPPASPPPPDSPVPTPSLQRTWGFILGGLGLVGLGIGAGFGGVALSRRSTLQAEAHDPSVGAARFYGDRSDVATIAAVSTVGLIAGGAALVAGVALVATVPRSPARAWIRVGPAVGGGVAAAVGREF